MKVATYELKFSGYWRAKYIDGVPNEPGFFCVYSTTPNNANGTVKLHELLFIGQEEKVRSNIYGHPEYGIWLHQLQPDQELCFSFASLGVDDDSALREIIKTALVFENDPKCNPELHKSVPHFDFPFTILTHGTNSHLKPEMQIGESLKLFG